MQNKAHMPQLGKTDVVGSQSPLETIIDEKINTLEFLKDNKEQQQTYRLRLLRLTGSCSFGSSFGRFLNFPVGYGRKRY